MEQQPKIKTPEEKEDYTRLVYDLDHLQAKANNGRGVSFVRDVVTRLKAGDMAGARAICVNESDKFGDIPEIKEFIIDKFYKRGDRHPWSFTEGLKK